MEVDGHDESSLLPHFMSSSSPDRGSSDPLFAASLKSLNTVPFYSNRNKNFGATSTTTSSVLFGGGTLDFDVPRSEGEAGMFHRGGGSGTKRKQGEASFVFSSSPHRTAFNKITGVNLEVLCQVNDTLASSVIAEKLEEAAPSLHEVLWNVLNLNPSQITLDEKVIERQVLAVCSRQQGAAALTVCITKLCREHLSGTTERIMALDDMEFLRSMLNTIDFHVTAINILGNIFGVLDDCFKQRFGTNVKFFLKSLFQSLCLNAPGPLQRLSYLLGNANENQPYVLPLVRALSSFDSGYSFLNESLFARFVSAPPRGEYKRKMVRNDAFGFDAVEESDLNRSHTKRANVTPQQQHSNHEDDEMAQAQNRVPPMIQQFGEFPVQTTFAHHNFDPRIGGRVSGGEVMHPDTIFLSAAAHGISNSNSANYPDSVMNYL